MKAKRSRRPTRLATLKTWQPATRTERTLRRQRIAFTGDPGELIERAAKTLVPRWRPLGFNVSGFRDATYASITFGSDEAGVRTMVRIDLLPSDVWAFAYYAVKVCRGQIGMCFADFASRDDGGDGGEELDVPTVRELSQMPVSIGLQ